MRGDVRLAVLGAAAAIVLAGGSTVTMAAVSGALTGPHPESAYPDRAVGAAMCTVPNLPGDVVAVTLADMGGRLSYGRHGAMMGSGSGPMMPGGWGAAGAMIVRVSPTSAVAGTVSLRVTNVGMLPHELVVLPLGGDARPGQRTVGSDSTADESGSVGEASNTCGADDGEGILPGGASWTTLRLAAGRYELICNLPGHYAAGMYADLDITAA